MAGPTCTILLPDGHDRSAVEDLISLASQEREGFDFWVADTTGIGGSYHGDMRPFLVDFAEESREPGENQALEARFGWSPRGQVGLAAMCNDPEDHQVLGEMAAWLAERTGGLVDLGGDVPLSEARISYEAADGGIAYCFVVDARMLRQWLADPAFYMVK